MTATTALKQRLLTPGPTQVPPTVLEEMALPIIHHRTRQFQAIFAEVGQRLQRVFRTTQPVLTITGSGTTAFEAAQISLARPGSRVITVAAGKFGERWQDVYDAYAESLGLKENIKLNVPWGEGASPEVIEQALRDNHDVSIVTVVHSETSTAAASDLKRIAQIVSKTDALLIADGITAVGALPVEMDAWGVDVIVTGSQKALMLPPGLGFVGLGERAQKRLEEVAPGGYYNLDLRRWLKGWKKNDVPFTPPVSLIRGQRVALEIIENEGLENVWKRTSAFAAGTRAAFMSMGLKLIADSPSDSVTGAFYPDGVDDSKFRAALRERHGIHIAGGQDGRGASWKNRILRISHMGYVSEEDTRAGLEAIEAELMAAGVKIEPGAAIRGFEGR